MIWLFRTYAACLVLITLLPLISTGRWYVRWWDFPRLQIATLAVVGILSPVCLAVFTTEGWASWIRVAESWIWLVGLLAIAVWQLSHIIKFSPLVPVEVREIDRPAASVKLMVANLDYENTGHEKQVERELLDEQADILLLIETTDHWLTQLKNLRDKYSFHHEEPLNEGLGMAVWSRVPMVAAETRYLVSERRPSIWCQVLFANGANANFVAVHPTPPGLLDSTGQTRRDSRVRDAELIRIADEIASRSDEAWIVAGDFNDVAWSHTTRLFKRVSGLKDPRIGRGLYSTYMADVPIARCPIDHVFLSSGFGVANLNRKRITGSDHFAVLTELALMSVRAGANPEPEHKNDEDAATLIREGISDAADRDVISDEAKEVQTTNEQ